MKTIFALMALVFVFSLPTHAQAAGGSGAGVRPSGGGSAGGGGGFSGSSGGQLSHTPTAQFAMAAASGTSSGFVPSAYLPFDQAVALGHNFAIATPANIVEVAQAYKNTKTSSPEHVIVQDRRGNLVDDSK